METVREEFASDVDMEQSFEVMSSEHEQMDRETIPKCPWEPPGPNISTSNEDNNLENPQCPGEDEQLRLNDLNLPTNSEQRLKIEELDKTVKDLHEELRKTKEGAKVHEEKIGNMQARWDSILKIGIFLIIIHAAIFVQWNLYVKSDQQTETLQINSRDMKQKLGKIEEKVKRDNEKVTNDIKEIRVVQRTNEAFDFAFKFTGEMEGEKRVAARGPIVSRFIKNDHFNEEDCFYTAPIAGIYLFSGYMSQTGSGRLDLFLETTGGNFGWSRLGNTRVHGEVAKSSVITQLSKGAKVHLSVCRDSEESNNASPYHLGLEGILILQTD